MRGHVRKKNGRYYIVIELDRDPATGKRRQKTVSPMKEFGLVKPPTKKETEELMRRYLAQMEAGTVAAPNDYTLEAWMKKWLEERNLRPQTKHSYEQVIRLHILPEIGSIPLRKLKPAHLHDLYQKKAREKRQDDDTTLLSPRTILYIHQVLRAALNSAMRLELIARNPALSVEPPTHKRTQRIPWDAEQAFAFLQGVQDHQYYPFYLTLLYTGLRRGEACGLRWEDVDLREGTINVCRTLTELNGEVVITEGGKTLSSKRTVSIPQTLVAALLEHRESPFTDRNGFVFTTDRQQPMRPSNINRHFSKTIKELDLPHVTLHDLRHTHATLLLAAGEQIKVVSDRLGHSTTSITMDIYAHALPNQRKAAADRIESIFSSVSGEAGYILETEGGKKEGK